MRRSTLAPLLIGACIAAAPAALMQNGQLPFKTVVAERSPSLRAVVRRQAGIWRDGLDEPAVTGASGLARIGRRVFVVQDDSTFLAAIEPGGAVERIRLFDPIEGADRFHDALGNKKLKPDLETLAVVPHSRALGGDALLLVGSGSIPDVRDRAALVVPGIPLSASRVMASRPRALYARLRADERLTGGLELNLEGLAFVDHGRTARFFNRGIGPSTAISASVDVDAEALVDYLVRAAASPDAPFDAPFSNPTRYALGSSRGFAVAIGDASPMRFGSGDDALEILVSAYTAEATDDPTADGATSGTQIALQFPDGRLIAVPVVGQDGRPVALKIEGLLLVRASWSGSRGAVQWLHATLLGVIDTDPDDPRVPSEAVEIELVYEPSPATT